MVVKKLDGRVLEPDSHTPTARRVGGFFEAGGGWTQRAAGQDLEVEKMTFPRFDPVFLRSFQWQFHGLDLETTAQSK